jgi:hypothetical protein
LNDQDGASRTSIPTTTAWYGQRWFILIAAVAATIWAVIRVGPRIPFPGAWYTGEQWPYPSLDELQAYKRTSPVGYLMAEFLGLDQSPLLVAFYFSAALAVSLLLALWVWRELNGSNQQNRGFRIAILAPVSGVLFLTLGGYDPFTALGWAFALFAWSANSRVLLAAAGLYLGFQHFEQSALMSVSLTLAVVALRNSGSGTWSGRYSPIWLLPGIIGGKLLLTVALMFQGVEPLDGRGFWVASSEWLSLAVIGSVNFGPIFVYSLFAGVWAIVILAFLIVDGSRNRILFALSLAIPVFISIVTLDHTRVFVMMTVPLVAILIVYVLSSPKVAAFSPLPILIETLAWIMVPVTIQGTSTVYVDSLNFLDINIIFFRQLLGVTPLIAG